MNASRLDLSRLTAHAVEPIPLKLAHSANNAGPERDRIEPAEAYNPLNVWIIALCCIFVLLIVLLISYFVVGCAHGGYDDDYHDYEEEY